jgi:hypothetical protein
MKAEQARKVKKQAESDHWRKVSEEREVESRRIKKANDHYMKNEYTKFENKVYSDIRKAAKLRENHIYVTDPNSAAWERLEKKLRADGYRVQGHHQAGEYENMGDFNAPCNIWRDAYWYYEVSW